MVKKSVLLVVFATLVIISVFAQSTDNASRIIGTWIDNDGTNTRWVFNSNGTVTIGNQTHRYGATDTLLSIKFNNSLLGTVVVYVYSLSPDGKILILYSSYDGTGVWLTK